jgi:3-deoxy-7-phosphoheptulonate synthase
MSSFNFSKSDFFLISGPCAVEDQQQMEAILNSENRPSLIRGGIYKMRTKKSSFQGLGKEAISIIKNLKKKHHFKYITEVTDPRQIEDLLPIVDCFQVGARNMYNYELLKELSLYKIPVILKRGFSSTISEWLGATEYLSDLGENNIYLCERGIRTFENKLRNTLDLGAVIYLKKNHPFKVIVDPSHAMGDSKYVIDASLAALAAGADGLLVEVHPNPSIALSDPEQALDLTMQSELIKKLNRACPLFEKELRV